MWGLAAPHTLLRCRDHSPPTFAVLGDDDAVARRQGHAVEGDCATGGAEGEGQPGAGGCLDWGQQHHGSVTVPIVRPRR